MTKKKRNSLIAVAIVVVLAIFIIANLGRSSGNVESVQVDKVKQGAITSEVTATGSVQARTTVKISADVSAKIVDLPVREGDLVKKGDVLVRLDPTRYDAAVSQAEAGVASARAAEKRAEASLIEARQTYERAKKLYAAQLISEEQYIQSETGHQVATANFESAQFLTKQQIAVLEQEKDVQRKTIITSPIDGTIVSLNAEVGEIVMIGTMNNPGTVIMTVADLSTIEVQVEVDETDVAKLQLDQPAKISVDAFPDSTFEGKVVEIGNAAQPSSSSATDRVMNFLVKILLTDTVPGIKPGMTATADIEVARRTGVLYVPIQAVVMRPEKVDSLKTRPEAEPSSGAIAAEVQPAATASSNEASKPKDIEGVFRVENGVAKFVPVATGIADQQNIEIKTGLKESDEIVSGSYRVLRALEDGRKVKIEAAPKTIENK